MTTTMYNYSDIVLLPNYSSVASRKEVDTTWRFNGYSFRLPVVPSNMECTMNFKIAETLDANGYFYIMHRFLPYDSIYDWICSADLKVISLSIGVNSPDIEFVLRLAKFVQEKQRKIDFLTIDVAHGDHLKVIRMINIVRDKLFPAVIIAGNVGTVDGCARLADAGAHIIKAGIGGGSPCTTFPVTGVGTPMFTLMRDCAAAGYKAMADGGCREIGDICKALAAGTEVVMVGGLFARLADSPAEIKDGKKCFFGSASKHNGARPSEYEEGKLIAVNIDSQDNYLSFLQKIERGIQSCCSYGGYYGVSDLQLGKMKWAIKG